MAALALIDDLLARLSGADEEKEPSVPSVMKCVQLHEYNDDMRKALRIDPDVSVPSPKEDEILVQVYSVSLNPVDWKIANGMLHKLGLHDPPLPAKFGYDFAGVVARVGSKVTSLRVGARVAGMLDLLCFNGTFSEFLVCPAKNATLLDSKVSFEQGAGACMTSLTAYQSLMAHTALRTRAGLKILVLGGSSSLGLNALQICRHFKASEIACTSSQEQLCRKFGATRVFNYKDSKAVPWQEALKGQQFDVVLDAVGGKDGGLQTFAYAQDVLNAAGGVFVSYNGMFERPKVANDNEKIEYYRFLIRSTENIDEVMQLMAQGELQLEIDEDSPYTLDSFFQMLDKSIAGKAHGKLILNIKK